MTDLLLLALILMIPGTLAGAVAGAMAARRAIADAADSAKLLRPTVRDVAIDPDLDHAARAWAERAGSPEASGIVAAKLQTLRTIGRRRGWTP